jgi:hypothetical protein
VPRASLASVLAAALAVAACGGAVVATPVTYIVDLPAPQDDAPLAEPEPANAPSRCPPDTLAEKGTCVRVVASPEIPAWEAPRGHGDPCALWTSDKGLVNCDPENENLPADAGRPHR